MDWKSLTTVYLDCSKPLIVVLGPTASGKTAFSIKLAQFLKSQNRTAEIINADSRQMYRYLDIGTAKITTEEQQGVAHHLFDVLDPSEELTAARYRDMAFVAIDDVLERGNIPVMVGGSMLYISAVIDGLSFAPVSDPSIRKKLEEEYDRDGGAAMYRELMETDPECASAFHQNNKPYVIRAMELFTSTGTIPSELKRAGECPYDCMLFGIKRERADLVERINKRVPAMFRAGWIEEVQSLIEKGYTKDDPAMKSHGYREVMSYLQKKDPQTLEELQELIAAKTRQYAKRQMTWWKRDERIHWISSE